MKKANPVVALREGNYHIGLYHVADSNKSAIGKENTHFTAQFAALDDINYQGPIILKLAAHDPFNTNKGKNFKETLQNQLK